MKLVRLEFIVAFLFIIPIASAQKYELGAVDIADLEQKFHPIDKDAPAAILLKKERVYFIISPNLYWNVITETDYQIKIYKKEGYSYANFEKPYYFGNQGDEVKFSKAVTYNLVNGAVEKTKLNKDGEFLVQNHKYKKTRKIALPNVKEGSIIEFKVTKTSFNFVSLDEFYFEELIPVNFAQYKVEIPASFGYNITSGGYLSPKVKDEMGKSNYVDMEKWRTYTLSNIKALKEEGYVNNIDNYRTRIKYELSQKMDQNSFIVKYATDWPTVAKKIYDNDDFGRQLEKNNYFEADIDLLLKGIASNEEKANLIFNYVQSRMNWNEYVGYSCDEGVVSAYKNKIGNTAEINLMLTAMLRYARINANPVLVSTRSNGIAIFPSRTGYNYVITAVQDANGVNTLYDATAKNSQPNILPFRALNWKGRMIKKTGESEEIDLMSQTVSKDVINATVVMDSKGVVTGKLRNVYTDYNAFGFREQYGDMSKETYLEKLEKKLHNSEVSDYDIKDKKELTKPITESYSFTNSNVSDQIGDKIYFSPMLFFAQSINPFKQEERKYPIDFAYPHQDRYSISITIPEGYTIESVPSPHTSALEGNLASFKYAIATTPKQVQLSVVVDINRSIISADYYLGLKELFKEMVTKENEKIILKKS